MNKLRIRLAAVLAFILVAAVLLYPNLLAMFDLPHNPQGLSAADIGGDIPPGFNGNRASFAFALASLFTVSTVSIRILFDLIHKLASEPWRKEPDVGLYRMTVAILLVSLVMQTAPDVALLFLWGEIGRDILTVVAVNRLLDGLAIFPFLAAIATLVRAEQLRRLPQMIVDGILRIHERMSPGQQLFAVLPRKEVARDNFRLVAGVMLVSLGLALFK